MSILVQTADPRVLVSSCLSTLKTRATLYSSSTDLNGKVACSRFARIALPIKASETTVEAALEVAEALVVPTEVAAVSVEVVVVSVAAATAAADAEVLADPPVVDTKPTILPPPRPRIHSLTSLLRELIQAKSFTSEM